MASKGSFKGGSFTDGLIASAKMLEADIVRLQIEQGPIKSANGAVAEINGELKKIEVILGNHQKDHADRATVVDKLPGAFFGESARGAFIASAKKAAILVSKIPLSIQLSEIRVGHNADQVVVVSDRTTTDLRQFLKTQIEIINNPQVSFEQAYTALNAIHEALIAHEVVAQYIGDTEEVEHVELASDERRSEEQTHVRYKKGYTDLLKETLSNLVSQTMTKGVEVENILKMIRIIKGGFQEIKEIQWLIQGIKGDAEFADKFSGLVSVTTDPGPLQNFFTHLLTLRYSALDKDVAQTRNHSVFTQAGSVGDNILAFPRVENFEKLHDFLLNDFVSQLNAYQKEHIKTALREEIQNHPERSAFTIAFILNNPDLFKDGYIEQMSFLNLALTEVVSRLPSSETLANEIAGIVDRASILVPDATIQPLINTIVVAVSPETSHLTQEDRTKLGLALSSIVLGNPKTPAAAALQDALIENAIFIRTYVASTISLDAIGRVYGKLYDLDQQGLLKPVLQLVAARAPSVASSSSGEEDFSSSEEEDGASRVLDGFDFPSPPPFPTQGVDEDGAAFDLPPPTSDEVVNAEADS